MESTQFKEEIEELVNKGYSSNVDFDIGSESFQHLRSIRKQLKFLNRINLILMVFVFLLSAALVFVLLSGNDDSTTASTPQDAALSSEEKNTVEKLKSENSLLKDKNASLQKDLKLIRKQFLSRNSEQQQISNDVVQEKNQEDGLIYHEVKGGETLYSIAEKWYGDREMYKKIISDNGLSAQSDIRIGKQLKIYRKQ